MATITPTRFDWTDDAAYSGGVNMNYANVRDIFKKILVDGMGAKPALGWTVQFTEGADRIVFRNPSDTFSLRVSQGAIGCHRVA